MHYSWQQPARQHGFTLLELLVVVVIVAILFTYTTLAIRSDSSEDLIKKEALRMERLIELALEEAILRGEEYAIEIFHDGYRFLRFNKNRWLPLEGDKILGARELPMDIELEMSLEETAITINPASKQQSKPDNEPDESPDDNEQDEESKAEPQIFLLSSGEITPEFEIRIYILGVETSYIVKGFFDGAVTTELSDL